MKRRIKKKLRSSVRRRKVLLAFPIQFTKWERWTAQNTDSRDLARVNSTEHLMCIRRARKEEKSAATSLYDHLWYQDRQWMIEEKDDSRMQSWDEWVPWCYIVILRIPPLRIRVKSANIWYAPTNLLGFHFGLDLGLLVVYVHYSTVHLIMCEFLFKFSFILEPELSIALQRTTSNKQN